MSKSQVLKGLFAFIVVLVIGFLVYFGLSGHHTATFQLGDLPADLHVARVADNPLKQARGLSGLALDSLQEDGMLFTYSTALVQNYWMKDMEFNLDFIWLKDGHIVKIDKNVPAPVAGQPVATVSSSPLAVNQVLELPAGKADIYGYFIGQDLHIILDGAK